jgi:SagB-type dehydrogenase family enzyme
MKRGKRTASIAAALFGAASAVLASEPRERGSQEPTMPLPAVSSARGLALEEALSRRRSVRDFGGRALSAEEIARLLWAAQGITERARGLRTAPSAGAIHPLEVYLVSPDGVFRYEPASHALARIATGDRRGQLARAALDQDAVRLAAVDVVLAGAEGKLASKYGARAERYLFLEAGHVAQNVLLEAVSLGLGSVPVGAFRDDEVARVVELPSGERALYVLAVGAVAK